MNEKAKEIFDEISSDLDRLKKQLKDFDKEQDEVYGLLDEIFVGVKALQTEIRENRDTFLAEAIEDFSKWRDVDSSKFSPEAQKQMNRMIWDRIDQRMKSVYGVSLPRPLWENS